MFWILKTKAEKPESSLSSNKVGFLRICLISFTEIRETWVSGLLTVRKRIFKKKSKRKPKEAIQATGRKGPSQVEV
ncbi:hypothetical protein Tco_0599516 [Tanacetum coccineum]